MNNIGTGGARAKLEAFKITQKAGIDGHWVSARTPDVLIRLMNGEKLGTFFPGLAKKLA